MRVPTRAGFPERTLKEGEVSWLKKKCPYFKDAYIDYLAAFRFRPAEQVTVTFVPSEFDPNWGQIEIEVHGLWVETILYEVPLMAVLSEAFFRTVDTAWSLEGQEGSTSDTSRLRRYLFFICRICLSERVGITPQRCHACRIRYEKETFPRNSRPRLGRSHTRPQGAI